MLSYITQPYDTLYGVARKFGITNAQILSVNPQINSNEQFFPGQIISIPGFIYEVNQGDTLTKISQQFNIPINILLSTNPQLMSYKNITVGQKIFITSARPPKSATEQAKEIETNANNILEDIGKNDWDKAESGFTIIKNNFNELKPVLQEFSVPQNLVNIISNSINNLENELAAKKVHESKVYAFIIKEYIPDIIDYFSYQ